LRIAILGTRGVPANYGGFETFAEECGAGLAARGHDVTVYCRSHYVSRNLRRHRGVSLVVLPTLRWKYTDTVVHTFFSAVHTLFKRYDAVLICNAANSAFAWIPRLRGTPVAVNVDGIERLRKKWNRLGRAYYRICEQLSISFADAVVTDARVIQQYYREKYGAESEFIAYGTTTLKTDTRASLDRLGLARGNYILYVSRLEPENNAHVVIAAYGKLRTSMPMVIVGDAPYSKDYIRSLKDSAGPRVLFPGAIYGEGYRELMSQAFCYIHATEVGGTHPALLEAMGMGNIVVANGTPENIEVLGDAGLVYEKNSAEDLAQNLQQIVDCPGRFVHLREKAEQRARAEYSWDAVVVRYEQLFTRMLRDSATREHQSA
jgi:glycosyltransferase involved in cell wall biosynthesis